ncbi:MAG TPA: carboxylesterase family protein [Edaphobacter sp.]
MILRKSFGHLLFSLTIASNIAHAAPAKSPDTIKTESGDVQGIIQDGVISFKGIPFAAPPVGELRWKAPQPAAHWTSVRKADQYGHDCMQLPFPGDAAPLGTPPAEDCLVLNVWAPATRSSAKLPVMVWIYGGGFVNGGSSPAVYDGSQFARQGVVFVSFNYRLGRFGFFAHPALTAEANGAPTGNFGYMDQIAALKWVQRNIAAFGGDPGQVTLFGESAGGGSVLTMLTSPLARGLFHRAIVESGGGRDLLTGSLQLSKQNSEGRPSAEQLGVNFAASKGITATGTEALKALRQLPAEQIVDRLNMASMYQATNTYPGPMVDGQIVVESPEKAFLTGHQMKIPIMIGANDSDIGFSFARTVDEVLAPFGKDKDRAAAAYNPENSTNARLVGARVAADRMMVEPARFIASQVAASGQPAYQYRFSYVAASVRKAWPGALHATEIPYVFDTVKARYEAALDPADEATAHAANTYWASFAKTGDPNSSGLPRWPAYTTASDTILDFTPKGPAAVADPWKTRLDLTEAVVTYKP